MSDYTPTRTAVRNSYISRRVRHGQRAVEARAEFEAWMAEHDAEVWDEGEKAGLRRADYEYGASGFQVVKRNPYREEQS